MANTKFGNTWWGAAWLKALTNIDYSNRLPRGVRYARNGSVVSIEIKQKYIHARVSGTRATPYKVKIVKKEFTKTEQEKIKKIILDNPYYLSQLASHKLPYTLLDDLERKNIALFPNSWQDMQASCSCPDWAVPCKHIAAVFYIIANEIDQNPFLVFDFHNYDLLTEISRTVDISKNKVNSLEQDITSWKALVSIKKTISKQNNAFQILQQIDLSTIAESDNDIINVLSQNPLFITDRDFRYVLAEMYKFNKKLITKFLNSTSQETQRLTQYQVTSIKLQKDSRDFAVELENDKQERILLNELEGLYQYFKQVDLAELQEANAQTVVFWFCLAFAFHLIKAGAYLPQIVNDTENRYLLRWIPALFKKNVSDIYHTMVEVIPENFVKIIDSKKESSTNPEEAVNFLISQIIKNIMQDYYIKISQRRMDKIDSFFFHDFSFCLKKFEDKQIPHTIHLWLSRFYLVHQLNSPVIKIDETAKGNEFLFEILVEEKQKKIETLIPLQKVLKQKKYEKMRLALLKDLSQLSEFLPVVNTYLARQAQTPISINSNEFVSIWFHSLPILEILRVKSLIPKSLKKIIKPQLTLSLKKSQKEMKVKSYLDLMQLLSFNWEIAIGDKFISKDEFFRHVSQLSGIVKYADRYIYIEQNELQKLMKTARQDIPSFTPTNLLRMGIEGKYKDVELDISNDLKRIFKNIFSVKKIAVPNGLKGTLRHYQTRGLQWLFHNAQIGFGSIIADDMGLGKTIQVISLLLKYQEQSDLSNPALIIVPTTLLTNWQKEFQKFAPTLNVTIYHGYKRELETNCQAVLTTYGVSRSDNRKLNKTRWSFIILDEAQNIKNPLTKQTKAIKSLNGNIRIAMTGTPVENRLSEYWSIMDFVNKGLLGSATSFRREFAMPIEKERDKGKLKQFLHITSPFIMRRVKADKSIIKDLPEKIVIDQFCLLTKQQTALYQNVVDSTMKLLDKTDSAQSIERKGAIFKLITSLKQICNHPVNFLKKGDKSLEDSGKTQFLTTLLEKILSNREKCLIFTQYKEMGNILQPLLTQKFETDVLFLHGGISRKKRDEMIEQFQNDQTKKIFILSLKAGGTGLNLTEANHVVHYDLWWNPAVENQATDRAYRIGQNKNVNVHRFITTGTFEEKINQMLESKKELFEISVQKGETWISEMSNSELQELVRLDLKS
ncbi:MAG: DEAD/DEAH box helicase [Candidatus Cloacimonetes bacterium]|nr:DEAD/DEAH box helicase [Candidatus Cloacimonadota bacterium]MCF7813471.1 DEAD/DEAH box helicase [Candidatus Cloacimonadota bacterium]MCF7869173.1 DEAD/DEAH box helicase [Candidatus Cloacimonadota bacterium]MCF7883393.1 DEAD/DEAH box helicase [Candidatus Cloacimonadota bacterium]